VDADSAILAVGQHGVPEHHLLWGQQQQSELAWRYPHRHQLLRSHAGADCAFASNGSEDDGDDRGVGPPHHCRRHYCPSESR
jgi:hypothetical protein